LYQQIEKEKLLYHQSKFTIMKNSFLLALNTPNIKMKLIALFLCLTLPFQRGYAQNSIKVGVQVGAGLSSVRYLGYTNPEVTVIPHSNILLQCFLEAEINKKLSLSFEPGLVTKGYTLKSTSTWGSFRITDKEGLFQLAALCNYNMNNKWQIGAGPVVGGYIGLIYIPTLTPEPVIVSKVVYEGVFQCTRAFNDKLSLGIRLSHGLKPDRIYSITDNQGKTIARQKQYSSYAVLCLRVRILPNR
jgi:hypothetical protein